MKDREKIDRWLLILAAVIALVVTALFMTGCKPPPDGEQEKETSAPTDGEDCSYEMVYIWTLEGQLLYSSETACNTVTKLKDWAEPVLYWMDSEGEEHWHKLGDSDIVHITTGTLYGENEEEDEYD